MIFFTFSKTPPEVSSKSQTQRELRRFSIWQKNLRVKHWLSFNLRQIRIVVNASTIFVTSRDPKRCFLLFSHFEMYSLWTKIHDPLLFLTSFYTKKKTKHFESFEANAIAAPSECSIQRPNNVIWSIGLSDFCKKLLTKKLVHEEKSYLCIWPGSIVKKQSQEADASGCLDQLNRALPRNKCITFNQLKQSSCFCKFTRHFASAGQLEFASSTWCWLCEMWQWQRQC